MKWITRSHVHVDRVACPWLITRFIDSEAEFLFVPANQIAQVAELQGAIPFDSPDGQPVGLISHPLQEVQRDTLARQKRCKRAFELHYHVAFPDLSYVLCFQKDLDRP